jgi:hypothetical protein
VSQQLQKKVIEESVVSDASAEQVATFGASFIDRLVSELGATRVDEFPELKTIRNLKGDDTGYVHVYTADKLIKATYLSINVAPGMRYFNIHIVPEARFNVPRLSLEGMVTVKGSQISMDVYSDADMFMEIEPLLEQLSGINAAYDDAKKTDIGFFPSRLPHMRAFCSPFFLNAAKATGDQLPELDAIANRYLDEWIQILANAEEVDAAAAADRQRRRTHMSDMVVKLDPDRQMIAQVFGEETTCAIEKAVMYW